MLDLVVSSLLINLSQVFSRGRRPSLGRTTLNCVFFFLYLLIFILCALDNRSHGVLEIVGGDLIAPNYWYHSKYGIPGYARNNWYRSILILSQRKDEATCLCRVKCFSACQPKSVRHNLTYLTDCRKSYHDLKLK